MLEIEDNGRTILDYLNEDCWHEVLSYVPVQDILRTERASRHWQGVVLRYLRGVSITVTEEAYRRNSKVCILDPRKYESFERWTHKLGSSVVATSCGSWESLETIRVTCPNLEALELVCRPYCAQGSFPHNLNEEFKCLKRLCFKLGRPEESDQFVSQFIADKALEELKFESCNEVTGQCLNTMNLSNLKCLSFDSCSRLKTEHILSAVEKLGELTELKLIFIDDELAEEIQPFLDKMPKLDYLEVYSDVMSLSVSCHTSEPLCRLTRLRHLKVCFQLGDDDVEAVTRCCKELRTLWLLDCLRMTADGAQAICRNAGARLTSLELLTFCDLQDDDVVAIIRGCPALTSLNVSGTVLLTPALPARAAAARLEARPARALRLDLTDTNLDNYYDFLNNYDGEELEEMKRQYEDMNNKYGYLIIMIKPEH